ncbi:protein PEAK3 [Crocuta crocuta]
MSSPEPPTETPGREAPTCSAQPTYSNLGEVRAHLLPSKACRPPRKSGSPLADPQPLPPPLPKKTLSRTQSLPIHGVPSHTPAPKGQPRRAFLGSHSVDESQADDGNARPACPPAEPAFSSFDAWPGLSGRDLNCPEAMHAVLEARQLEGLRTVHARLQARLLGGHPGPCHPGHGFRLLDSSPHVESGDALYYRMVRMSNGAWHLLAAKEGPLGRWLQVRRAGLVLHLAERASGGEAPGLEDWLYCEYLAEATEASLGHALALLWD